VAAPNGSGQSPPDHLAAVPPGPGLPPDEAQRRVTEVESKARQAVKDAADKAAKTGAYVSFWTFMSLLFGAAAATLAGILGGQLRDTEGRLAPAD
jgi:hypothetical protein